MRGRTEGVMPAIASDAVQISVSWSPVKTTLDLRDGLLSKAKQQAAKEHIPLTRMIEEGLTLVLGASGPVVVS
jgi:hypothetical protein